jgi:cysteine desulfurase/selenocysteine lyase
MSTPPQLIHLNHAGASPSPPSVLERVQEHTALEREMGGYAAAEWVQDDIDQVYTDVANFIHARSPDEIALTESATVAWTRIFYSMVQYHTAREQQQHRTSTTTRNVILISEAEYAASVVAACQWARDHDWTVLGIPSGQNSDGTSTGIVDLHVMDTMLAGNYEYRDASGVTQTLDPSTIAVVCITHVPTNSGIVNPVHEIGQRIDVTKDKDIFYLVDACQSVGHLDINVHDIRCHALVATGRKYLRGPRGTGFLYVSDSIVNELMPTHLDHYGTPISTVPSDYQDGDSVQTVLDFGPRPGAKRFEFWESNVANRIGFGLAIQEAAKKGAKNIEEDCNRISKELRSELVGIPGVIIHHAKSTTCGIVTFYSTKLDSATIVSKLFEQGFGLSVVPATSTPLDSAKAKVPNLVRVSVSYTTTIEEIKDICREISALVGSEPDEDF